ncbi:MAG: hypothetical protein L3K15_06120 [Thermoplasmata archaeon]|nr:hypothetical protein [Thermoplasmata archaeon]
MELPTRPTRETASGRRFPTGLAAPASGLGHLRKIFESERGVVGRRRLDHMFGDSVKTGSNSISLPFALSIEQAFADPSVGRLLLCEVATAFHVAGLDLGNLGIVDADGMSSLLRCDRDSVERAFVRVQSQDRAGSVRFGCWLAAD